LLNGFGKNSISVLDDYLTAVIHLSIRQARLEISPRPGKRVAAQTRRCIPRSLKLPQRDEQTSMKTNIQLQQDVIEELKWEPSVDCVQIGVEVKDGIVTLAGHVDSYAEKWNAERAAQRVTGVKGLAIEIDVRPPGASQRSDGDIARSAENVLQ
jgi:BON domain